LEFAVRKKNKWARFKYLSQAYVFMPYSPFVYEDISSLPEGKLIPNDDQNLVLGFLATNYNAVDFDVIDGGGYMIKFKDFKTHKLGFYYGEGDLEPVLMPLYDSIEVDESASVLIASKGGKSGAFSLEGESILPIQYDEIELVFLDFTYGLMSQKNKQWSLVDAQSSDLLLEENYPTKEALMQAWGDR
jgi:hypothetical protein